MQHFSVKMLKELTDVTGLYSVYNIKNILKTQFLFYFLQNKFQFYVLY